MGPEGFSCGTWKPYDKYKVGNDKDGTLFFKIDNDTITLELNNTSESFKYSGGT